jgi:dienelactone hydrolase
MIKGFITRNDVPTAVSSGNPAMFLSVTCASVRALRFAAVVVALAGATLIARPYLHGLSFVIRAADMQGTARRVADLDTTPVLERDVTVPVGHTAMRARVYEPRHSKRTTLLVSGLHVSGIDEPRLVRLARHLAENSITVVTPDIPELSQFEIAPSLTDTIEQTAAWLAGDSGLAPDRTIGMMGISFSGGLSIIAAGRSSLAGHVAYVFAFGGHDDLPRVLRYLCTGQEPMPPRRINLQPGADQPFTRSPHDYGVAVILLGIANRLVPPAQVEPLRAAVRQYLVASALDGGVDKARAPEEFETLRGTMKRLPEPSATLMRYVLDRDVAHLGARLLPYVAALGGDPALSVSRSPKPAAPVFLLHGLEDNVIPSVESEYLADDLRPRAPVRLLLSGLISHAEADRPIRIPDVMQLASFWGDLLSR